ncbi:MAG: hypothetical protein AB7S54_02320 [Bacteroidales bacterium]
MKKSIFLFSVTLIVYSMNLYSQQYIDFNVMGEGYFRVNNVTKRDIDGSTYLFHDWNSGKVKLLGKDEIFVDSLGFDVRLNNLMFSQKGVMYSVLNQSNVEYFIVNDRKFVNFRSKDFPASFYEILVDGENIKLLKFYKCIIVEGTNNNGIDPGRNDKYKIISDYYTVKDKTNPILLKNRKKIVINLMKDRKSEIETFIDTNKINIKDQNDLIRVFNYYNSL